MKTSLSKLIFNITNKCFLDFEKNSLVSMSGGQDSQLLFYSFLHFQKYFTSHIEIVYCHHFWQFINFFTIWEIWKITLLFEIPISIILPQKVFLTEENARQWRQENFHRISEFLNIDQIAFGHTQSDLIETAFLNLFRGTSSKGISTVNNSKYLKNNLYDLYFPCSTNLLIKKETFQKIKSLNYKPSNFFQKNRFSRNFSKQKTHIQVNFQLLKRPWSNDQVRPWSHAFTASQMQEQVKPSNFLKINKIHLRIFVFLLKILNLNKYYSTNFEAYSFIQKPLQPYYRHNITGLVLKQFLPVIPDPTNQNLILNRNKIRLQFLPILRRNFDTRCDIHISNFLQLTLLEQEFFVELTEKLINDNLNSVNIKKLPVTVRNQILYRLFSSYIKRQVIVEQINFVDLKIK